MWGEREQAPALQNSFMTMYSLLQWDHSIVKAQGGIASDKDQGSMRERGSNKKSRAEPG
jgi:hypothetical protein